MQSVHCLGNFIWNKLGIAFYAMKSVKPYTLLETLNMVDGAYFHYVVYYGFVLSRNPSHIAKIKKKKRT
jgi:hypothetical protein